METGALYYGDCLEVMKNWPPGCVDLIYLDPPFNSKTNYNVLFGAGRVGDEGADLAQLTAFTDTWQWDEGAQRRVELIKRAVGHPAHLSISAFSERYPDGSGMLSYLSYMAERLAVMKSLLRRTGSIYLHCDPTASHYLKIVMDDIFRADNFRNEIVWCYSGPSRSSFHFPRKHDCILFYSKSERNSFFSDAMRIPHKRQTLSAGATGMAGGGRSFEEIRANEAESLKRGKVVEDWWPDIGSGSHMPKKERLGYPTQKPLALLERIIKASSKEDDVVLDPFCGCGTTIEAAHNLRRRWVGIDISTYAIEVIRRERMNDMKIPVHGVPKDLAAARHFAQTKPFDFEKWAVTRIRGFAPNTVQRGDGGIDGRGKLHDPVLKNGLCIAQVKGGKPSVNDLRAFCGSLRGGKAAMGVFITLNQWNSPAVRQCIADAGKLTIGATEYNRLVMYSIDEHFNNIRPDLPALAHPRTGKAMQEELLDFQDGRRQ